MDHLRQHPSFVALPLPDDLPKLSNLEDVRNIRQDSWQWDVLHDGRCTTSQAVAALGFLECKAGRLLEIPSTWQRRGIGACTRLRQRALRTLDEMNDALLADNPVEAEAEEVVTARIKQHSARLWKKNDPLLQQGKSKANNSGNTSSYPKTTFAAHYLHKVSAEEKRVRARRSKQYAGNGMGIRMIWGDAQEPTSVLTALNHFTQENPDAVVKEVGMCGAGLKLNQTDGSSASNLLIGATPDGVIEYPDGSLEALEVKNHCPFVFARRTKRKNVPKKQYTIRELPFKTPYIFPLYVPQLMLEMLCLGPQCKSAVMVRQTATTGALILRIHRDDEWIDEMLYWLQRFQQDFVEAGVEPEPNFFFDSPEDGPRYRSFLERTKKLASKVDLVARVPHKSIQRSAAENSLFLD